MATKKTKVDPANDIPVLATDAKAFAKKASAWPKVKKGTHLTVYTYEDGSTKLEWDDEQLLKEVREAIASVEVKPAVKAKAKKKVPEAMKRKEPEKKVVAKKVAAKKAPAKKTVAKKKTK